MDRETELRLQLDALKREYDAKMEPLVKELIEIINRKPRPPIILVTGNFEDVIKSVFGGFADDICQCAECQAVRAANAEHEGKLN